jgi:transposase
MRKKWLWAGIDLGVETASICVIDSDGNVVHENSCACSAVQIRRELCTFRRTRFASVGLEAGTGMHAARGLRSYGYPIELYEPRQLSKFLRARRNKTDAGDAKGIAEAGRISASIVSKVYLKPLECQALQSRLAIRRHLIRQRVATVNMLSRQIELFGGRLHCQVGTDAFEAAVRAEIRKLSPDRTSELVHQLRFLMQHSRSLISYQRDVDRELKLVALDIDVCRRFMEIPGVGPLCALTFYAAIGEPHRFSCSADIGSYFGLAPKLHESGLTSKKSRISKMGNRSARALLVRAATMYMRYCDRESALRDWALRLEERSGRGKSRVALARKLAVIMLSMWKNGDRFVSRQRPTIVELMYDGPESEMAGPHNTPVQPAALELGQ